MSDRSEHSPRRAVRFYGPGNEATRIDLFEELSQTAVAALRSFFRRLGAPHLLDEVILPTLQEGDTRIFAAVRDRPWPPWGLGARHVSAVCQVQATTTRATPSPRVVTTGISQCRLTAPSTRGLGAGRQSRRRGEYMVAGIVAAHHFLTDHGFRPYDDVFRPKRRAISLSQRGRRCGVARLNASTTPDCWLRGAPAVLERTAVTRRSSAGRRRWTRPDRAASVSRSSGGARGRPAACPLEPNDGDGASGRGWVVASLENFLGEARQSLIAMPSQGADPAATVVEGPTGRQRRSRALRRSTT